MRVSEMLVWSGFVARTSVTPQLQQWVIIRQALSSRLEGHSVGYGGDGLLSDRLPSEMMSTYGRQQALHQVARLSLHLRLTYSPPETTPEL